MSTISKLLVTWGAGGSLAEVPGVYQNSGIQLLKQVSHNRSQACRGARELGWCASVHR